MRHFALLSLVFLTLLYSACSVPIYTCIDPLGCLEIASGSPIIIASMLATSGDYASIGLDSQRGMDLAVATKEELFGHSIKIRHERTDCTHESALETATKLATREDLVAVIGPTCSAEISVAPILYDAGLIFVSPSATDTLSSFTPSFFSMSYSFEASAILAAEFSIRSLDFHRAGIIRVDDSASNQRANTFILHFTELNGNINFDKTITTINNDYTEILNDMANDSPEVLYLSLPAMISALFIKQLIATSTLKKITIIGNENLISPDFAQIIGETDQNIYIIGPDSATFANDYPNFLARYEHEYLQKPISFYHSYAYDAAMLIFRAIEQVAVALNNGNLYIPRCAFRESLFSTKQFSGISGIYQCKKYGICSTSQFAVYQLTGSLVPKKVFP